MRGTVFRQEYDSMLRTNILIGLMLFPVAAAAAGEMAKEHPLMPVIKYASERYRAIDEQVKDYTCTVVKREQVDGRLSDPEFLFMKLRHGKVAQGQAVVAFAVYLRFMAPAEVRDREVVFFEGRYDGQLIARRGGLRMAYVTVAVNPSGELAMQGNRYPITEIGFKNLLARLLEVAREDIQHGECDVKYYTGAKVNGRGATLVEVTHPVRRPYFRYHIARIFIDDELQLPIRYAAYDWPEEGRGEPRLMEEYTYLNLKLNVGLTDWDFDYRNESYEFRKDFEPR
jgi:hypothetical protein